MEVIKGIPFFNRRYTKGVPFLSKMVYSYFEKGCPKKCARDHPERVIWDMIDTLFLTLQLSSLLLLLSLSISKHTSMASLAILSNFFEEQ